MAGAVVPVKVAPLDLTVDLVAAVMAEQTALQPKQADLAFIPAAHI
jgi:hypothetical protein